MRSPSPSILLALALIPPFGACNDPGGPGQEQSLIAFDASTTTDWSFDIYTFGLFGGSLKQLTTHPGDDYEPVWSADGSEIFFTSDGRPEAVHGVFVMKPDGSNIRLVAPHPRASAGGLSPDRTRVAYVDAVGDLYVSALDGSGAQQIAQVGVRQECPGGISCNVDATHPRWSPDGTTIAFVTISQGRGGSRYGTLYLVHSDGTELRSISGGPASVRDPEWSADGTRITVVSDGGFGGSTGNVWVLILLTGIWGVVTPYSEWGSGSDLPQALLFGSNWSPRGEALVYATYDASGVVVPGQQAIGRGLWTIGADGGAPHSVHSGLEVYRNPAWRPNP